MKTKIITVIALLFIGLSSTFAQDTRMVSSSIEKEFQKEFADASQVQWKTLDQFYKASFMIDGAAYDAFYTADGKLNAVSRKLKVEQLPMPLIKEAKEKAKNSAITDLFELLTDRGTEYFMTIGVDKEIKTFRSESNEWVRY